MPVSEKFARRRVHGIFDLASVTTFVHGGDKEVEGFVWLGDWGREASFIADSRRFDYGSADTLLVT